jgi:hypothetical protein
MKGTILKNIYYIKYCNVMSQKQAFSSAINKEIKIREILEEIKVMEK